MRKPRSIIVVGSSGNGKTTLVNGLRPYVDEFVFPQRYITRPHRRGDDLVENKHVTHNEFNRLLAKDRMAVAWQRPLGKDRYERYGFEVLPSLSLAYIPVYSANNALLRDAGAQLPESFFQDSFIVLVKAPLEVRRERMFKRSPDIRAEEMDIRLKDDGLDLAALSDLTLDTSTLAPGTVVKLVRQATGHN